jgi:hypothetical protein
MPFFLSVLMVVQAINWREAPAGSILHVRLTGAVGSFASRPGSPIQAVLIAPVKVNGETVLPAGSILNGRVKAVRRVGLGVLHEAASLDPVFDSIALPGEVSRPLVTQLAAVDNGREDVTPEGSIREVRSSGSWGNRAAHYLRSFLLLDVHAQLIAWAVKSIVVQVPEPEIYLPSGAELTLALSKPVRVMTKPRSEDAARPLTEDEFASLSPIISDLPDRSFTPPSRSFDAGRPADLVNLLFIGSRPEISAAFTAAGWVEARPKSFRAGVSEAMATALNRSDPDAPMSAMRIHNVAAGMSWQKGFNDVSKRHHIRLWKLDETWQGQELWVGAATRDVEFGYLRPGRIATHRVEEQVDHERDKIVYDIAFASCAEAEDWVVRPDATRMTRNATGDRMETDGELAVVRMNDCSNPRRIAEGVDTLPVHGGIWQRLLRREILAVRSDLIRGNIYWRAYEGARSLFAVIQNRRQPADPDTAPQVTWASRLQPGGLSSIVSFR